MAASLIDLGVALRGVGTAPTLENVLEAVSIVQRAASAIQLIQDVPGQDAFGMETDEWAGQFFKGSPDAFSARCFLSAYMAWCDVSGRSPKTVSAAANRVITEEVTKGDMVTLLEEFESLNLKPPGGIDVFQNPEPASGMDEEEKEVVKEEEVVAVMKKYGKGLEDAFPALITAAAFFSQASSKIQGGGYGLLFLPNNDDPVPDNVLGYVFGRGLVEIDYNNASRANDKSAWTPLSKPDPTQFDVMGWWKATGDLDVVPAVITAIRSSIVKKEEDGTGPLAPIKEEQGDQTPLPAEPANVKTEPQPSPSVPPSLVPDLPPPQPPGQGSTPVPPPAGDGTPTLSMQDAENLLTTVNTAADNSKVSAKSIKDWISSHAKLKGDPIEVEVFSSGSKKAYLAVARICIMLAAGFPRERIVDIINKETKLTVPMIKSISKMVTSPDAVPLPSTRSELVTTISGLAFPSPPWVTWSTPTAALTSGDAFDQDYDSSEEDPPALYE